MDQITRQIIRAAYEVSNTLGSGFLEKVYENALAHELRQSGLHVEQQQPVKVYYDDVVVGDYYADLVVDGKVIVELKAAKGIDDVHLAQCINYLVATGFKLGLILNFGMPRVQIKRVVNNY